VFCPLEVEHLEHQLVDAGDRNPVHRAAPIVFPNSSASSGAHVRISTLTRPAGG
jgi:hypothetical protein